jgi:hypothetical protein
VSKISETLLPPRASLVVLRKVKEKIISLDRKKNPFIRILPNLMEIIMAKELKDYTIGIIHSLDNIAIKIERNEDAVSNQLGNIGNKIRSLDSTISNEITELTKAIRQLTDEVRIAVNSDLYTNKRERFFELRQIEEKIHYNERMIDRWLEKQFDLKKDCKDCREGAEVEKTENYQRLELRINRCQKETIELEEQLHDLVRSYGMYR